ncbi:retrotransposon protein, putative, ty1-copia subclass [Tanacetum coccineum]
MESVDGDELNEVTTSAGNAPSKSSYANVTSKPSGKKLNICTLFTLRGSGIDMFVLVESIQAISDRFANTTYGFFLGKRVAYPVVANYVRNTWGKYGLAQDVSTVPVWVKLHGVPVTAFSNDGLSAIATKLGTPLMLDSYTSDMCMQSWGRLSYARVMIELRADMELKDNIVVAMPRIKKEGHYLCNVRVEYEWKPPRCTSCKVFGHIHEECLKNTGVGKNNTLKKPSQTSRGVPVGPKMGFKPHKEYRHVPKKPNASSRGNKKKGVEPTIEVSNYNPFDVLNSVDNDAELDLLSSGQAILVDNAGNPLKKVEFPGDYDSEDEVASVDNDMARSLASERVGFGTQSLLEQWRDLYGNDDYDEDPYNEDMYEGHDVTEEIQAICDNLDI